MPQNNEVYSSSYVKHHLKFYMWRTIKFTDGRYGPGQKKIHKHSITHFMLSQLNDMSRRVRFSTGQ